jgi:4-amino-4-deoxy-L-arabinose transferase-like glycosyltransferase
VPGAVMFLWLLLYRQWRRLLPFYLPTGALLFLAVAAPWHVVVAARNPEWVRFYFVHEHWLRFFSTVHGRTEPWWFFIPIVLIGLFPWVGFVGPAARAALARHGRSVEDRALDGFLLLWIGFIFLFFSAAGSKLAPYILPVFPPCAVLISRWITASRPAGAAGWRWGWGTASALLGLFAATLLAVAVRPTLATDVPIADLRPWFVVTALLLIAGIVLMWRQALRGAPFRVAGIAGASAVVFYVVLVGGLGARLDFHSTREFARIVTEQARPDEPVYQYERIYQDFLFYARRPVGMVDEHTELELDLDPAARNSGRFIDLAEFHRQWAGPTRVWIMLRESDLPRLEAGGAFRYHLCAKTAKLLLLLCNQPDHDQAAEPSS